MLCLGCPNVVSADGMGTRCPLCQARAWLTHSFTRPLLKGPLFAWQFCPLPREEPVRSASVTPLEQEDLREPGPACSGHRCRCQRSVPVTRARPSALTFGPDRGTRTQRGQDQAPLLAPRTLRPG